MKSITEFAQPTLQKVLAAKAALGEGKTAEEISASIGETMKLEGDKLKFAIAAADLTADKSSVRRVMVVTFGEGETVPPRYQKVDDTYYLVETLELSRPAAAAAPTGKGQGRGGPRKGGNSGGPKGSPWGASPEEIEAKKKASLAAQQAKKA